MTIDEVRSIVGRHVEEWNSNPNNRPLWVVMAKPGDQIQIPGITFGKSGDPKAGMHVQINAELIVLNQAMVLESLLATFLHELGHAKYKSTDSETWNEVDSEVAAVIQSLCSLHDEGFPHVARREAQALIEMSRDEPYLSAKLKIQEHPIWQHSLDIQPDETNP